MRAFNRLLLFVVPALISAFAVSCSLIKKEHGPEAQIVIGDVSVERGGDLRPVAAGFVFRPYDAAVIAGASKLKIVSGTGGIFVNENALFKAMHQSETDSCAIAAERGEFYFAARDGGVLACRFGNMLITMNTADAALIIDPSGRSAIFFVLNGRAQIRRGSGERHVVACQAVLLDASGISEDVSADGSRGKILENLKNWVGETAIERAAALGKCRPELPAEVEVFGEDDVDSLDSVGSDESGDEDGGIVISPRASAAPQRAPAVFDSIISNGASSAAHRSAQSTPPPAQQQPATTRQQQPPSTQIQQQPVPEETPKTAIQRLQSPPANDLAIGSIRGPNRIYAGDEFTLRGEIIGRSSAATAGYVWRFKGGGVSFERKTGEPQVTLTIDKSGEFAVACEVLGDSGVISTQYVMINVLPALTQISAGGPYSAAVDRPVRFLGNARNRFGKIVKYEWFLTDYRKPDFSSGENIVVEYAFSKPGVYTAIFKVSLADGSSASDTAVVNVRE